MTTYDTLDIRDFKEQGGHLRQAIVNAVKDTQSTIIRPLPSKLVITRDQYDILQDDPELQQMYRSKDHLYMTPDNVMEVEIK